MGYQTALEAAGAIVHEFEEFGDYHGTWIARVTYNGETGFVVGSYGSCSGCDAFQSEFDYGWGTYDRELERYVPKPKHLRALAEFGREYLTDIVTADYIYERYKKDADWDIDMRKLLEYIRRYMGAEGGE